MTVEVPEQLEAALKARADAQGISAEGYVRAVLERELGPGDESAASSKPFKNIRGILAMYGPTPSEEDIAEMRREAWRNFGESY